MSTNPTPDYLEIGQSVEVDGYVMTRTPEGTFLTPATEVYDPQVILEVYRDLGEMDSPLDLIDLPDISALVPFDGFPDRVTDLPEPVTRNRELRSAYEGEGLPMDNIEAQMIASDLARCGAGTIPPNEYGGDYTTVYSHVPTYDGSDVEIRALIFRSVPGDPTISDRGALACWVTSTPSLDTLQYVLEYEQDGMTLDSAYDVIDDYVDMESAVKVFSVYIPDSVNATEEQEEQFENLIAEVAVQWLEPTPEMIDTRAGLEEILLKIEREEKRANKK